MRAEVVPYAVDPFGPSANPSAYVACEASERARGILERSLDEGRVAALIGPPGHGKTLLLRLLGGREEDRARVAYVPFCTLEFDELCALVLNAIGVARPGPPRDALAAVTRELAPRGGVVILVDDAHAMSDACATALAALYEELGGALRIALAAVQGVAGQRVVRAFGSKIDVVLLAGGMTGRESRRYVEMRLAYGGAQPEIVAAFDEATIDALHRASQGVPRRLNQVAEDIVRRATRSELPRLREIAAARGVAASAARPVAAVALELPLEKDAPLQMPVPPAVVAPAAPALPAPPAVTAVPIGSAATERTGLPAPAPPAARPPARHESGRRPAPRLPRPAAPASASPERPGDDRGILLPEIFDREPGEPAGEYRIVRGTPVTENRGVAPATPRRQSGVVPSSVHVVIDDEPGPRPAPARHREIPMPSAYADRVPRPSRPPGPPIRAIGVAGFVLGVAGAMAWILGSESSPPRALPPAPKPPAIAPAKPPAAQIQKHNRAAAAPPARAPEARVPEVPAPAPVAPIPAPAARVLVSINATPWASVRIDGREVGETPLAGIPLEAGRHVFEARMPDGTMREQTVDVSAQRRTVVFQ
jgi:type II secretory pathway predicted ATPase ExeA